MIERRFRVRCDQPRCRWTEDVEDEGDLPRGWRVGPDGHACPRCWADAAPTDAALGAVTIKHLRDFAAEYGYGVPQRGWECDLCMRRGCQDCDGTALHAGVRKALRELTEEHRKGLTLGALNHVPQRALLRHWQSLRAPIHIPALGRVEILVNDGDAALFDGWERALFPAELVGIFEDAAALAARGVPSAETVLAHVGRDLLAQRRPS